MWCNWNPLKRCWYSEQIQQQLNIPSSSYFHRTLHFIQPNNLFSFSVSFWMGNLSRKIESNLNGNRQFMASTIYSWQKPSREWKKNRIECKQNTRNNMLDASISLIPMPLKCNTTEPPLRETHSSTIIRKSEPFRWNREILSQEYMQ